jgi:hypothetical protein
MSNRVRGTLAFWALAGVALLVSHDAVFLVQVGPGEGLARALRTAGHDYWGAASLRIAGVGLVAALAIVARLSALRRTAHSLGAVPSPNRGYLRRAARSWVALLLIVATGFVIQESAEHLVLHGHPIGLGALVGPEYPLALPVIAAITALAGLVAAAVAGVERSLLAGIADALSRLPRAPLGAPMRPPLATAHRSSVLSRPGASRAPPAFAT